MVYTSEPNGYLLIHVVDRLQRATGPDSGGWYTAICPFHDDNHPSLRFNNNGFRCMACGEKGGLRVLAGKLGIEISHDDQQGLTVSELANAKGLPEDFLRSFGVVNGVTGAGANRRSCVDTQHMDQASELASVQKRLSLHGSPRFIWRRGDKAIHYGLWRLKEFRSLGYLLLVEGASDCWTCWYHSVPALGLPGASTRKERYATLLQGLTVYPWHEPDQGGDGLAVNIIQDLPEARIIEAPPEAKDISELYMLAPNEFEERLWALMTAARPASEIRAEALSKEARDSLRLSSNLLEDANLISLLSNTLLASDCAGDARPALVAYVILTSRLLGEPLKAAYISLSAAGKNAAVDAALPFFPASAYHIVRASSPRALICSDEVSTHKIVVITEADSLPEDGPAASALRSLMSGKEMTYDVVEKGADGKMLIRRMVNPGPPDLSPPASSLWGNRPAPGR